MVLFQTLAKYFIADLPVIMTAFFCMWCVINIYLPGLKKSRKWITLLSIELFEHIMVPIILFIILIVFNNGIAALAFNAALILFLFGFLGKVVVKAKGKEWLSIVAIAGFTYFFVFFYPYLLITLQIYTPVRGWTILLVTALLFFIVYRRSKKNG